MKRENRLKILIPENKITDNFNFINDFKNDLDNIKLSKPEYNCPDNLSVEQYFEKLCQEGLKQKYGDNITQDILNRYEKEKSVIFESGFSDIFLWHKDLIDWAKDNDIKLGVYRGSAIGSLVCYILGITKIDPLKYGLLFERFINSDRFKKPVIEIDVEAGKKDKLIEYIINNFGCEYTATAKELSVSLFYTDKKEYMPLKTIIFASNDKIKNAVPLGKLCDEIYISFEDADTFEKSNCLKFTVHPSDILEELKGIDISSVSYNEKITPSFFSKEILESSFIQNNFSKKGIALFEQIKPENIRELTALCSLDRQAVIESGMTEKYINAKNSDNIEYYNDDIKSVLEETFGEIIYQEQIMQILNITGDFSLEEADMIRRYMVKGEAFTEIENLFIEKAKEKGIKYLKAKELWNKMQSSAKYCFIKAHSTSWALLLYSYLKSVFSNYELTLSK